MFKAVVFALLAGNTAYFAWIGATSKAIDAAAWLALLTLFVAETRLAGRLHDRGRLALRAARLAAGAAVVGATLRYVFDESVLDTVNSLVWIAIVVLLEMQFRYPQVVARSRTIFTVTALALYGALGVLVVMWGVRAEWFDAYDALVWLVAFATIELDVIGADTARQRTKPG